MPEDLLDAYMEPLLIGDRVTCRDIVHNELAARTSGKDVYEHLLWPAMEQIDTLFRKDRINTAVEHMATRINRALADQVQRALKPREANGRSVLITCADGEPEELGAQMCADLFEADGWGVYFLGGGVPNDEIQALVGRIRPDILLIYGTQPQGVPGVRQLVDSIREVACNPSMNIMVSGGVFNRADGLWKEINADIFAATVRQAIELANGAQPRPPEVRIPGAPKKRRRRRRPPLLATADA